MMETLLVSARYGFLLQALDSVKIGRARKDHSLAWRFEAPTMSNSEAAMTSSEWRSRVRHVYLQSTLYLLKKLDEQKKQFV